VGKGVLFCAPLIHYLVVPCFMTVRLYTLDNGETYMVEDLSINANSATYAWVQGWALAFIPVYPLGIPLYYLYLLRGAREYLNPELPPPRGNKPRCGQTVLVEGVMRWYSCAAAVYDDEDSYDDEDDDGDVLMMTTP
jgi:hypothetical protein